MKGNLRKVTSFLYRFGKRILLLLSVVLLIVLLINLKLIISTLRFFYLMNQVPPWSSWQGPPETYPLDKLKEVALFLLEQPEHNHRHIIIMYQTYIEVRSWKDGAFEDVPPASKLYLLLRLLFQVPEEHPSDDSRFFGDWIGIPAGPHQRDPDNTFTNLLWPLGYEDHNLVLKASYLNYRGFPYSGLAEYDYFSSRFQLREKPELK